MLCIYQIIISYITGADRQQQQHHRQALAFPFHNSRTNLIHSLIISPLLLLLTITNYGGSASATDNDCNVHLLWRSRYNLLLIRNRNWTKTSASIAGTGNNCNYWRMREDTALLLLITVFLTITGFVDQVKSKTRSQYTRQQLQRTTTLIKSWMISNTCRKRHLLISLYAHSSLIFHTLSRAGSMEAQQSDRLRRRIDLLVVGPHCCTPAQLQLNEEKWWVN